MEVTKVQPQFYQYKPPKEATLPIQRLVVYFQVVNCGLAGHLSFA